MRQPPDPYRELGVPRGASEEQIKAAHRRLAKRYHPDASSGERERFLAIQEAYLVLTDPIRRREWDARHAPGPVRASPGPTHGAPMARSRRGTQPRPDVTGTTARTSLGPRADPPHQGGPLRRPVSPGPRPIPGPRPGSPGGRTSSPREARARSQRIGAAVRASVARRRAVGSPGWLAADPARRRAVGSLGWRGVGSPGWLAADPARRPARPRSTPPRARSVRSIEWHGMVQRCPAVLPTGRCRPPAWRSVPLSGYPVGHRNRGASRR